MLYLKCLFFLTFAHGVFAHYLTHYNDVKVCFDDPKIEYTGFKIKLMGINTFDDLKEVLISYIRSNKDVKKNGELCNESDILEFVKLVGNNVLGYICDSKYAYPESNCGALESYFLDKEKCVSAPFFKNLENIECIKICFFKNRKFDLEYNFDCINFGKVVKIFEKELREYCAKLKETKGLKDSYDDLVESGGIKEIYKMLLEEKIYEVKKYLSSDKCYYTNFAVWFYECRARFRYIIHNVGRIMEENGKMVLHFLSKIQYEYQIEIYNSDHKLFDDYVLEKWRSKLIYDKVKKLENFNFKNGVIYEIDGLYCFFTNIKNVIVDDKTKVVKIILADKNIKFKKFRHKSYSSPFLFFGFNPDIDKCGNLKDSFKFYSFQGNCFDFKSFYLSEKNFVVGPVRTFEGKRKMRNNGCCCSLC